VTALLHSLKRRYTILHVEHGMDAVFALADRISVLVYGRVIFTGTPDEIRAPPDPCEAVGARRAIAMRRTAGCVASASRTRLRAFMRFSQAATPVM
jgi:ABC-type multidrug transport system ATPase subunit